jgi:hypothetical protein
LGLPYRRQECIWRRREAQLPDIFDEVEEELRAERTRQFLTRYAGAIVAAALVVVALVAAWQGWRWYQARQDQAAGAVYLQAMLEADQPGPTATTMQAASMAAFTQLAQRGPASYRTLARLQTAALEAKAGHLPQALALWNEVAADSSADPLLRELAGLLWAQHQLETGDPGILEARLKPLAEPSDPWHSMATEQLALLSLRQGKTDEAKKMLTALANDLTAPQGVRESASAVLAQLPG